MNSNLSNFKTANNSDWSTWVKLVKKVYKAQGYNLTQQQALIIAKESYPGKGNVVGNDEKKLENDIPVHGDKIPENPVRRKRQPPPTEAPKTYKRDNKTRKPHRDEYDECPRGRSREKENRRKRDLYSSDEESPPRRRQSQKEKPPRESVRAEAPRRKHSKRFEEENSDSEYSSDEYEPVKRYRNSSPEYVRKPKDSRSKRSRERDY